MDGVGVLLPELVHLLGIVGVGCVDEGVRARRCVRFRGAGLACSFFRRRLVVSKRSVERAGLCDTSRGGREGGSPPSRRGMDREEMLRNMVLEM